MPNFVSRDKVISTSSKRIFEFVVPNGTTYIVCNSPCVVYLTTCKRCFLHYVGKTVQKLNKSFSWHRTGFRQSGKYSFCQIISDHFHKVVYCNASYSLQILKKLEGNWRTTRNAMKGSTRKQHEEIWMLKLITIYPYSLNDRLEDEYKKENTHVLVGTKFPHVPSKHDKVSYRTIHKNINPFSPDEFLMKLKHHPSLRKPIDSYWFEMSCLIRLIFSCVYCFFLKRLNYIKVFLLHE